MAMENDMNFDDLFGDMFGSSDNGSDPFANIFNNEEPKKEEKKEEPAPASAEEAPAETQSTEDEAVSEEPAPEKAEEKMEEIPVEEKETEETAAEAQTEAAAVTAEENVSEEKPATEETKEKETAEEEPEPEVKVEKKTRRRRSKKVAAEKTDSEPATSGSTPIAGNVVESKEVDEAFLNSLLMPLGPKYAEQKKHVNELMNNIVLAPDMKPAVVQAMIAQNAELARYVEIVGEGYFEAYDTLTDKETGLITRVKAQAAIETNGTKEDKQNAGIIALAHYKDPKSGKEINLMDYANALRAAKKFFDGAKNYSKAVGISLTNYNKLAS